MQETVCLRKWLLPEDTEGRHEENEADNTPTEAQTEEAIREVVVERLV